MIQYETNAHLILETDKSTISSACLKWKKQGEYVTVHQTGSGKELKLTKHQLKLLKGNLESIIADLED